MAIEPFDWNVVVVGYWNPAILVPRWIATRLLELDEKTPVTVEISLDGPGPHRVRHEGVVISVEHGRLNIAAESPTMKNLERAKYIAGNAIKALPETPLTAAGFNMRFKLKNAPEEFFRAIDITADKSFADADLIIKVRKTIRSFKYKEKGVINFEIMLSDDDTIIEFNFHLQSPISFELRDWLSLSCEESRKICTKILNGIGVKNTEEGWQ
jgi:hypothetical protein